MSLLGGAIVEAIVAEYGRSELLRRLGDPFWFQSLGCVLGMDWHSSGITTSVMHALKKAVNERSQDLGIYICGGRGRSSRQTPAELLQVAERTGLDGQALVRDSRLAAKVDNTAVQDGFQLYLHNFVVTADGEWAVVQQGMNPATRMARRYHWLSSSLVMPTRHEVRASDVNLKRLGAALMLAHESEVRDMEELLLLEGVGPRTLQSLTLVSEVIYGTPSRFADPARFSFAHGGKDGYPFPVPTQVYDETIAIFDDAIHRARLGDRDKADALRNLSQIAARLEEHYEPSPFLEDWIAQERADAWRWGGRTVHGKSKPPHEEPQGEAMPRQLSLWE